MSDCDRIVAENERGERDDETQVGEPPTLKVWWTAHMKGLDNQVNEHFYVTRSGYWHGSVLGLVRWFTAQAQILRTPCEAFKLMPERIGVRDWPSTLEMLNAASAALDDQNPSLLPLPPGHGVLYISGHVTEGEWLEIRDAACGRRVLRGI
jgi:hypothetical protein